MTSETNLFSRLHRRARRTSLQWQICVLTGLAVLISLSVMGYVGFMRARDVVVKAKLDTLASETEVAIGGIEHVLAAAGEDVERVPLFPPIPGIIRCLDNDGETDPEQTGSTTAIWIQRLGTILTAQMRGRPERIKATVIGADGTEIASVERGETVAPVSATGERFEPNSFVAETLSSLPGDITVSRIVVDPSTNRRNVHLGTPYVDTDGEVRGVFAITLNLDSILNQAAAGIQSGVTDIIDERGKYLFCEAHPQYAIDERDYRQDEPLRAQRLATDDSFVELIPGSARRDGVSLVAVYKKIYYAGDDQTRYWVVAPSLTAAEALTDVTALGYHFFWLASILIVAVGVATFFVSKGLTRSLRRLTATADRIAQGDLETEMPHDDPMGEVKNLTDSLVTMTRSLRSTIENAEQQQRRTSAILDSTADGIISIDQHGTIRSVNNAAATLFGVHADAIVGQNVSQFVPALHDENVRYDSAPLHAGEVRALGAEDEVLACHRDGHTLPLAMRVTEMDYAGERLFIATLQDITERKRTEEERRLAEIEQTRAQQEQNRLFDGIREAVKTLAAASSEILASTSQQATSAQQQASSVTETATTVEELTHTAEEASGRAKEVAESASKADQVGKSGRESVSATITAMHHVREQVESIADNITALSERAQAISDIIETVNDIADQTNLLALNAAIEASRAGEHGRGFAVVASEVKDLADQSRKATTKVSDILGEIQDATHTAVLATEQGTKSVVKAEQVIGEADLTIETLSRTISDAAISAKQILASANQQATAMRQIRDAINYIDLGTKQTLAATRQSEQSARDLNSLGDQLTKLIARTDHQED